MIRIRATYAEMQSDANGISKAAEEYKTNVDSLYGIVDNLSSVWQGKDNLDFASTVNGYKEDLKSLGDIVNSYAEFLNKAASTISQTQDEISGAATRL